MITRFRIEVEDTIQDRVIKKLHKASAQMIRYVAGGSRSDWNCTQSVISWDATVGAYRGRVVYKRVARDRTGAEIL